MSKFFKTLFALALAFLVYSCSSPDGPVFNNRDEVRNWIGNLAKQAREKWNNPAIAIAIMDSDEIISKMVIGYRRNDTKEPVNSNDKFHLGSNAKAILSFVAGKMVEEGKITWDRKFFDLYPELKDAAQQEYWDVTLEQLFSHRARVKQMESVSDLMEMPDFIGTDSEVKMQFIKWILTFEPINLTGKTFAYSNAGYTMAGLMLEKVAAKPLEEIITGHLQEDLDLEVGFGRPHETDIHQPWPHVRVAGDSMVVIPPDDNVFFRVTAEIAPAGNVNMNLADYAKFIQMHLKGLMGKDGYLSRNTYEFLHFSNAEYGMGWGHFKHSGKRLSAHSGSDNSFYARVLILPDDDMAFVILTNVGSQTGDDDEATEWITNEILEKYNVF